MKRLNELMLALAGADLANLDAVEKQCNAEFRMQNAEMQVIRLFCILHLKF